jgi:hypothetical protein
MTTHLREELTALAETQTFSPDPTAWERGRRARRRTRVVRGAALVAVVALVAGAGALAVRPDAVAPAGDVRGGAIPSRVDYGVGDFEDDYAIGRASVALGGNHLVLISAEDGRYHHFTIPGQVFALSPDGYRVAWWSDDGVLDVAGVVRLNPDRIYFADLRTGDVTEFAHNMGSGAEVTSLTWAPDSVQLRWNGSDDEGARVAAWIDITGPSEDSDIQGRYGARGIPSPSFDMMALASEGEVDAAPFEQGPPRRSSRVTGIPVDRTLPADLYPDGAVVTPVGWADEDTLVAIIDPPPSDVVERPRLALLTSPDVRESEGIFREFLPRLPPEATSFAVDLIPDLTGDPDQELTHDFSVTPTGDSEGGRTPIVVGGLMALLAGIAFIRMMQKRA